MQSCKVSGREMAYRREGEGEPMLLVHGITTYFFHLAQCHPVAHAPL